MTQGTIRSLRTDRGFGFITPDAGGEDLFFHTSAVAGHAFDQLHEGQRVSFAAGVDPRNPQRTRAEDVQPITE